MTPMASPLSSITTRALISFLSMVWATSSTGVSGRQVITPWCIQSFTVTLAMVCFLCSRSHELRRYFDHFIPSALHGFEIFLDNFVCVQGQHANPVPADIFLGGWWDRSPYLRGVGALMLDKDRAAGYQSREGISDIKRVYVVERLEIDVTQFRVGADRLFSHR